MAKFRSVNTKFWDDNYIITLKPIEKLLFLYFLTNPLTNICGAYEISIGRICFDTGINQDLLKTILDKFLKEKKVFYRDGWVVLPNFIKNQSLNPSVKEGIKENLLNMPKWIVKIVDSDRLYTGSPQADTPNLTKPNITKPNAASGSGPNFKNENPGADRKKTPSSFQSVGDMLKKKSQNNY